MSWNTVNTPEFHVPLSVLTMSMFIFRGHQEVLRAEGKCVQYDPVPLILVKDIISFMPQMKYMFAANMGAAHSDPAAKRQRIS